MNLPRILAKCHDRPPRSSRLGQWFRLPILLCLGGVLLAAEAPPTQSSDFPDSAISLKVSLSHRTVSICRDGDVVRMFPVAIGRPGWETPRGSFQVLNMRENPTWKHPLTGRIVPPGHPENPMGRYWIEFSTDGKTCIGFHGTPEPKTVGKAVSHGCLRMFPKDIEQLFREVCVGTSVQVVP